MATTIFNQLAPIDALTFDGVEFLRVTPSITVTDHPIESGLSVTDHAQSQPIPIAVRGHVTETPLGLPAPSAIELALSFFERSERQLMTISTDRGVFSDVLITQYAWDLQPGRIVFDVTLRKVRIAFAVSVPIPARQPAPAVSAGAASPANAGVQPTVPPATPPPTSLLGSMAAFL